MAHYGHGTGNYLTNFEDYYKSTEESEEEGECSGAREIKAEVDSGSSYYTESEEEDRPSYQGIKKKENPRKEEEKKSLNDFKIRAKSLQSLRDCAVEESDEDIVNANDKEKSTEAISIPDGTNTVSEEQLSDNYADLLKTVCKGRFHLLAKLWTTPISEFKSLISDLRLFSSLF